MKIPFISCYYLKKMAPSRMPTRRVQPSSLLDAEHAYESLVRDFRYFGGSVKTVLIDKSTLQTDQNLVLQRPYHSHFVVRGTASFMPYLDKSKRVKLCNFMFLWAR
ncbi:hypothetical protein GWK46_00250 [Serratia fonticola]|nr:hypothetical protein [Serratia fonticola]